MIQIIINSIEQSHTLAILRDTLLPKLMKGEVRVRTADGRRFLDDADGKTDLFIDSAKSAQSGESAVQTSSA
jgi:hypothetical protein